MTGSRGWQSDRERVFETNIPKYALSVLKSVRLTEEQRRVPPMDGIGIPTV